MASPSIGKDHASPETSTSFTIARNGWKRPFTPIPRRRKIPRVTPRARTPCPSLGEAQRPGGGGSLSLAASLRRCASHVPAVARLYPGGPCGPRTPGVLRRNAALKRRFWNRVKKFKLDESRRSLDESAGKLDEVRRAQFGSETLVMMVGKKNTNHRQRNTTLSQPNPSMQVPLSWLPLPPLRGCVSSPPFPEPQPSLPPPLRQTLPTSLLPLHPPTLSLDARLCFMFLTPPVRVGPTALRRLAMRMPQPVNSSFPSHFAIMAPPKNTYVSCAFRSF